MATATATESHPGATADPAHLDAENALATSLGRMDQAGLTLNGGGWLALALVNAGLAEQKNRSRFTWFFVSLFIGPLATFLIVVWQRAPVDAIEPLHPFSNRRDRWLVLGGFGVVVALVLGFFALIDGNWYTGGGSIAVFALALWALMLYGRAAAVARRE